MLHIKKLVSSCLAAALVAGAAFNANIHQVLAAETNDIYESAFTVDIDAEAQNKDGSIHQMNDCIESGTTLEVTSNSLTVDLRVKGEEFEFQNTDGILNYDVIYFENDADGNSVLRTYRIQIADVTDRMLTQSSGGSKADDISEFYLALIVDDNVLDRINEVYTADTDPQENVSDTKSADNNGVDYLTTFSAVTGDSRDSDAAQNDVTDADTETLSLFTLSTLAAVTVTGTETSDDATFSLLAASTLADGEYTIEIQALEMYSDAVHSRDEDIDSSAKLIVSNGQIDVYFSSAGRELTFQNSSGVFENKTISTEVPEDSEIRSDGVNLSTTRNYMVSISSLSDEIVARFPAASSDSGALTFRIVLLESTLNAVNVSNSDTGKSTSDSGSTTSGTDGSTSGSGSSSSGSGESSSSGSSTPKTGDESQILFVVLALISAYGVGACTLYLREKKSIGIN